MLRLALLAGLHDVARVLRYTLGLVPVSLVGLVERSFDDVVRDARAAHFHLARENIPVRQDPRVRGRPRAFAYWDLARYAWRTSRDGEEIIQERLAGGNVR